MAEVRRSNRNRWNCDVFISFRGSDMRKAFLSHFLHSLKISGIHTFTDNNMERGQSILIAQIKAIENSKVHVVLLSKNYASSSWCLDELLQIMRCCEGDTGHTVIPVFYGVTPSDVRHLKGSYGKCFNKHKKNGKPENELEDWKNALNQISNISGFCTDENSSEAALVDDVIRKILEWLPSSYLHLPKYAVGIRSRARCICELMRFELDDALIIGIWGMGGSGKTTLAKAAYNELSYDFEGTCFLENFGEHSKQLEGKLHLQRKLLSDILKRDDIIFKNMDHQVKERFRNKRVLVVIDDVKELMEYNSIAIDLSCFGPGSRIFVTSRDKHLLEQLGVENENIYSPEALNYDESLELLSLHAFRKKEPREGFLQLSEELVDHCAGLPLAIEVLGALLYKKEEAVWRSTLELLKQRSNANIKTKLQISFDSLSPEEKDVFLDISCFFIGMDKDYVSCILDGCNLYPASGLTVLTDRCLITVCDNRLLMHDLLRDMGRQIIRETSPKNCEKWSRLWESDDVIDVLTNNSGPADIEGLSMKAEVTAIENLEVKAFSNLRKLRLLQLSHVSFNGSYEHFPKQLRWLCWFKFPLGSLPENLHLKYLVVMDMQYSNLKQLWDDREPPLLKTLKYLYLSHSVQLTYTPDFSYLPNLEMLLLIGCKSLVRIHNSIWKLQHKLVLLNLKDCTELRDLPLELYTLKSLETLILSGCSQLERLDYAIGEMNSLKTFKVDYTGLKQVPSSINQLKNLEDLSFDGCKELWNTKNYAHSDESPQVSLPILLSKKGLTYLKTLSLGYCNLSDELVHLGSLPCLQKLDLRGNNFRDLQTDFACLLSLQDLKLDGCSELVSMFSLPKTLRSFGATNCIKLKRTPDLSECSVLESLYLTNCINLDATPGLDKLKWVRVIHMEMCNSIPNTYRERIMQGLTVGGNGRIFISGSELPNWVSLKNKTHSISFTVPESLNLDLVGFTLSTRYKSLQNNVISTDSPHITVKNRTKGVVCRRIVADQILMYHEKHIWQGHFSNEDFCLETGDEVEVSVNFGNQVTIHETGITLSYKDRVTDVPYEQFTHTEQEVDYELVDTRIILETGDEMELLRNSGGEEQNIESSLDSSWSLHTQAQQRHAATFNSHQTELPMIRSYVVDRVDGIKTIETTMDDILHQNEHEENFSATFELDLVTNASQQEIQVALNWKSKRKRHPDLEEGKSSKTREKKERNSGDKVSILETGLTLSYTDRFADIPNEQSTQTEQEVDDELVEKKRKVHLSGIWEWLETFLGRVWSIDIRCYLVHLCVASATIAAIKLKSIRRKMLKWILVCLRFLRLLSFK